MRKSSRFSTVLLGALLFTLSSFAQGVTINGNVQSTGNSEGVPSVSVTVKNSNQGVFTDANGSFKITVPRLPVVLVFTSVGFESQEVTVSSAATPVTVNFVSTSSLG